MFADMDEDALADELAQLEQVREILKCLHAACACSMKLCMQQQGVPGRARSQTSSRSWGRCEAGARGNHARSMARSCNQRVQPLRALHPGIRMPSRAPLHLKI